MFKGEAQAGETLATWRKTSTWKPRVHQGNGELCAGDKGAVCWEVADGMY